MAETLKWPLLLPKDMDALKNVRQQDLFMSLKRDLALVSFSTWSPRHCASILVFLSHGVFLLLLRGRLGGFRCQRVGEGRLK